jgi:hypothetical protein
MIGIALAVGAAACNTSTPTSPATTPSGRTPVQMHADSSSTSLIGGMMGGGGKQDVNSAAATLAH